MNNHAFTGAIPALPWSGTRDTGFGVANGPEALATFVRPAHHRRSPDAPEIFWMPYDDDAASSSATSSPTRSSRASSASGGCRCSCGGGIQKVRAFFS